MKHILLLITIACLAFTSCTDDTLPTVNEECVVGEPAFVNIHFGGNGFEDIQVSTRSTQDGSFEHLISNMYVMLFKQTPDGTGTKVYGSFFDVSNKKPTIKYVEEIANTANEKNDECWTVEPAVLTDNPTDYDTLTKNAKGIIRIKAPIGGAYKMYIVANINASYLQTSEDVFEAFRTEEELKDYILKLLHNPVDRQGSLLMTAQAADVHIIEGPNKYHTKIAVGEGTAEKVLDKNNPLYFERTDARVEFRVRIDKSKNPKMLDFIPESWEVVNLPNSSKLFESDNFISANDESYYNLNPSNFEKVVPLNLKYKNESGQEIDYTVSDNRFSFYMLENHPGQGRTSASNYNDREKRKKKVNGQYEFTSGDMWECAPQYGTYVKIKGQIKMKAEENALTFMPQTLFADVCYYVHLGDFNDDAKGGFNNYNVDRNTRYTYKITIYDVKNIQLEVESSKPGKTFEENQPGAAGNVFVAKEKVAVFDAHYGQQVFRVIANKEYVNEKVTWHVDTPFGSGTAKENPDGTFATEGLDFTWVKFYRNRVINGKYSHKNRCYPGDQYLAKYDKNGDKLMYVDELVKYMKDQFKLKKKGKPNDFRDEEFTAKDGNKVTMGVIYITAFIDEFYYEVNPFSGLADPYLWTKFVNQPQRMMHILCSDDVSYDGESSTTGSVFTIRQYSIQTPYTTEPLTDENGKPITAWGCETIDESGLNFENGTGLKYPGDNLKQTTRTNGLYNTWHAFLEDNKSWANYLRIDTHDSSDPLDWELPESFDNAAAVQVSGTERHDTHFLNDAHHNLRYSFILRNRDNNGNGQIDPEELHWYVASVENLTELYFGGEGLSSQAKLYPDGIKDLQGYYHDGFGINKDSLCMDRQKWRHHVISSTVVDDNSKPRILWAEEGLSLSNWGQDKGWGKNGANSIRCIRNLGVGNWDAEDSTAAQPTPMIKMTSNGNSGFYVDCRRINKKSLRGGGVINPDLRNLGTGDETNAFSYLPMGFEVLSLSENVVREQEPTNELQTQMDEDIKRLSPYIPEQDDKVRKYDRIKYILDNGLELYMYKPSSTLGKWRMPNVRELGVLSLNQKLGSSKYYSPSTYYSHGVYGNNFDQKTRSWYMKDNFVSLLGGWEDFFVLLVRDWDPR